MTASAPLQFIFDQVTKTAMVVQGERIATVPGQVTSQAEAERRGRQVARALGWADFSDSYGFEDGGRSDVSKSV